jgi:hypothetical protein
MLEGATAHRYGPPDPFQQFLPAVDVPSLLLFGPVRIVYLACSLYVYFLYCIAWTFTQLASSCASVLRYCMLQTRIQHPLRKEHAL